MNILMQEVAFIPNETIDFKADMFAGTPLKRSNFRKNCRKNNRLLAKFMCEELKKEIVRLKMTENYKEQDLAVLWHLKSRLEREYGC